MDESLVKRIWQGTGFGAIATRALLTPFEWVYGIASATVGARRAREAGHSAVPTVSVGNLSVGGTGKTPLAAWFAAELRSRGLRPALLMRGYGDDEPKVHELLNPDVPVYPDPERRRSGKKALAQGATALVLDDGFQHRQMPRDLDVVLLSADGWDGRVRLLPVGPYRELLPSLRRAHLVVVTRKAADASQAAQAVRAVRDIAPRVPVAVAHLAPQRLVRWSDRATAAVGDLRGETLTLVSGIGNPEAFAAQVRALGADIEVVTFGDHHAFSETDVQVVASRARGSARVICTLKDAVKLGPRWPADAPALWYLSQAVIWETGEADVRALLDRVVPPAAHSTPASTGPKTDTTNG